MIDLVCIFCGRDIALQRLQAFSIARYFGRADLREVLYIWQDTAPPPQTLLEELTVCLDGISLTLMTADQLEVEEAAIAFDGWTTQQALKLLAAQYVTTDSYLVLDAKNHFLYPCSITDFVARDGKGIFPMTNLAGNESYRYCLEYFGVEPQASDYRGVSNVTPFLLNTAMVERMLTTLVRKEGCTAVSTFMRHHHKLTEFLAYQAYALSEGVGPTDLFQATTGRIEETLWASTVQNAARFERCMQRLEHGDAKVLGLHWMASCLLSSAQRQRVCELWLARGLVTSMPEGEAILDSVAESVRKGEEEYLHDFLEKGRSSPPRRPDVSVIVPVHNKEPFLVACLESILAQTLQSLELICVDDASTDGCAEIIDRFAERDARITVIRHEQARGATAARNAGLAAARGEFVQFTDADDLLTPEALELLLSKARIDDVDVVRGGVVDFRPETPGLQAAADIPPERSRFRPLEHERLWVRWRHQTYLFTRRFLLSRGISFSELCSGEDPGFLARVLTRAPYLSTISEVTYRHRLPLPDQTGGATYRHLGEYLRHAESIRGLILEAQPAAWYRRIGPFLRSEIRSMLHQCQITPDERALADSEMQRIFELTTVNPRAPVQRKLLFMYGVCGLGGVETSILNKMRGLEESGVHVRALFQSFWGEGGKLLARYPGFVVEPDEDAQKQFIRKWSPDAIVVIDTPRLVNVVKRSGVRCPVLFETHMSELEAFDKRRILDSASDPRVAMVIAPSEFNGSILLERGFDPRRVRSVPNPVDLERFRPGQDTNFLARLRLPKDRPLVLFVGRLEPQKNPLEFVNVCAELVGQNQNVHGVVLGDAVNTVEYAASVRAAAASIGGRVSFIPRVAYEDMPSLYEAAATSHGCLISTSLHESQPMIVLEAMACRCPVVVSDVGGVREIVRDGRTGHLYPLGDIQRAAEAVIQLIDDPAHRRAIVTAANDYVRSAHSPVRAAEAYIAILDELSASSEPADPRQHATR